MNWLDQKLNRKFVAGTAAGLLISSLVFLGLFISMYRSELAQERSAAAGQVNRLLQTSLENAMLKRDLEGLRTIINRLGTQPEIHSVMITNPAGEIRFASDPTLLGGMIRAASELAGKSISEFTMAPDGREILRSINPVHNKAPCNECHGPIAVNPINGVLYVDYDAAPIRRNARSTTLLLMSSGALIVLINITGGWWFIRRFIIQPVDKLSAASKRLAIGDLNARVQMDSSDELAQLGGAFNQMAEKLQLKMRELREKEQFLNQLVDAIPDGVRIIDADFRVLLANRTCREQLGCNPGPGRDAYCYSQAHQRETPCPETLLTCPVAEIHKHPQPLKVVHKHTRPNGATMNVEIYSAPMHVTRDGEPQLLVVESVRDLEQKVKFSHEQKLSELGRLAAGVAHEIHNPLASVRLALHAAQRESDPENSELTEYLALVDNEVDKCIQVTERLLKLSVPPPSQPELVELDRVADEVLRLLQWDAENQKVAIQLEVEQGPLRILATDSEARMVMLNLAQNALHAMPDGGSLSVRCSREEGFIVIEVHDSGIGIPDGDLVHIFEPFFSRRADGVRGTGLGLSITKTIVENYGGSIDVDSRAHEGSQFVARFPDADSEDED